VCVCVGVGGWGVCFVCLVQCECGSVGVSCRVYVGLSVCLVQCVWVCWVVCLLQCKSLFVGVL
jgi:hypothetical protein